MKTTLLLITTLSTGLMAGLFYSWTISVTPGLARLNDENYLRAFQSMNRAIINPVFLIVFITIHYLHHTWVSQVGGLHLSNDTWQNFQYLAAYGHRYHSFIYQEGLNLKRKVT